jgi:hypothetical protein
MEKDFAEERLAICKACEHFSKKNTCKRCGCLMSVKVNLPGSECPIKKWTKVVIDER